MNKGDFRSKNDSSYHRYIIDMMKDFKSLDIDDNKIPPKISPPLPQKKSKSQKMCLRIAISPGLIFRILRYAIIVILLTKDILS